jgi:hypothetical protein
MHLVDFSDLDFAKRKVRKRTNLGTQYERWEPFGMPRIPDQILNCVFYLYASEADAKAGKNFGGTGFFIFFPMFDGPQEGTTVRGWTYAVTNWHVAVRDGFSVIRVNTKDGKTEIFDFGPEEWEFDQRFDIAVKQFHLDSNAHKFSVVPTRGFCSEFVADNLGIGPGDDVFMIGRFINHDGGQTNLPAARLGHISINPTPMEQGPIPSEQNCYCIDLHSRTGYSGSPVFVFRNGASEIEDILKGPIGAPLMNTTRYFGLVGIHFAQFPEIWELERGASQEDESLISGKSKEYVRGMSGMTCVLPAWNIIEVLNMPTFVKGRGGRKIELTLAHLQNLKPDASKPVEESAPRATDESPTHREDFNSLLGAAARKQKQGD